MLVVSPSEGFRILSECLNRGSEVNTLACGFKLRLSFDCSLAVSLGETLLDCRAIKRVSVLWLIGVDVTIKEVAEKDPGARGYWGSTANKFSVKCEFGRDLDLTVDDLGVVEIFPGAYGYSFGIVLGTVAQAPAERCPEEPACCLDARVDVVV